MSIPHNTRRFIDLSYANLATAVSDAGGLGQIGCACFSTPEELQADIQKAKLFAKMPLRVIFPIGHIPLDAFVDAALAEEPAVITVMEEMLRQ